MMIMNDDVYEIPDNYKQAIKDHEDGKISYEQLILAAMTDDTEEEAYCQGEFY